MEPVIPPLRSEPRAPPRFLHSGDKCNVYRWIEVCNLEDEGDFPARDEGPDINHVMFTSHRIGNTETYFCQFQQSSQPSCLGANYALA